MHRRDGLRLLVDAPLTFDVGDRTVHSPMVHAEVGGTSTKLILDTGSSDHVLTMSLASCAGLHARAGEPGTDHAGALVASWDLGDVPIRVGETTLPLRNVVAFHGPEQFEGWGIGGFLSPQNLHPSAVLVIDLVGSALILAQDDLEHVTRWLESRYPMLRALALRRESSEDMLVRASVVPFDGVPVMLNTGSSGTEFARSAVPGLRGTASAGHDLGVSGAVVDGEVVRDRVVMVGDASFPVSSLLVREHIPAEHGSGHLGMDILRGTVVAVAPDPTEPIRWFVPRPGAGT